MKNKKGFTLIEIIIAISLIAVIGTSVFLISLNNIKKSNKERLEKLHNQILNAANVFISSEKDEEGVNYNSAINIGAKGVKIPITYLVDEGYIDEKTVSEVYKLEKLDNSKNYFVLAVNGGSENNQDYCDAGDITFTLSWMYEDKPIYLCKAYKKYTETKETVNNIQEVQNNVRLKVSLDKIAVSEEYYNSLSDDVKSNYVKDENGIFTLNDENVGKVYSYYRGSVNSNYLKLGKDSNDKDLMWRILWIDEDNKVKLVLDDEIPLKITKSNGEIYYVKKGDKILSYNRYNILNYEIINDPSPPDNYDHYYIINYNNSQDLLDKMIYLKTSVNSADNIYYQQLNEWYNSTNLNDYSIITKTNNFCKNNYYRFKQGTSYKDERKYYFEPSSTFDCVGGAYGSVDKEQPKSYDYSTLFYSNSVGFLTYGDVVRAGFNPNKESDVIKSGSYLLHNSNNSYPLVDESYKEDIEDKHYFFKVSNSIYYINNDGLHSGEIYSSIRDSTDEERTNYYSLLDENGEYIFKEKRNNHGNPYAGLYKSIFLANSIKPAIIIDLTNKKLDGDGTSEKPFLVVDKE